VPIVDANLHLSRRRRTPTNGNLGHQSVLCTAWPQGEFGPGTMSHQRYFRWVDRKPSPLLTTTAQRPSPSLPSPPLTSPASSTSTSHAATYCRFAGCKWKRAPARDCTRNMCRTHCQLSGGCQRKDHISKASSQDAPLPAALPAAPASSPSAPDSSPSLHIDDSLIDPLLRTHPPSTPQPIPPPPPANPYPPAPRYAV
jgi:hypothetical protein